MGVNQVLVGDEVKLDLTADTVSEDNLLAGVTAHNAVGEPITGTVVVAPVDSEMSETSENPVQNRVISKAIKGTETLSGSAGYTVTDSVEYPIIGLKFFGRSKQDGNPTIEHPVQIISTIQNSIMLRGKNLLDISLNNSFNRRCECAKNSDGSITVTCIQDGETFIGNYFTVDNVGQTLLNNLGLVPIKKNDIVTFSCANSESFVSFFVDANLKILKATNNSTMQADEDCYATMRINLGKTIVAGTNITVYPQIELGSTATDYEPFKGNTLTIPFALNAIPVSSGGNVTIDGQEYIADYVDFEEGKYHRLVDPDKLDPTVSIVDNLDLLLENEEISDIPEAEMQAYRQLYTYNGVTTISNDKGAGIEVSYCTNKALSTCVAPITSGLQKQIDDLKSAVISLGGNV